MIAGRITSFRRGVARWATRGSLPRLYDDVTENSVRRSGILIVMDRPVLFGEEWLESVAPGSGREVKPVTVRAVRWGLTRIKCLWIWSESMAVNTAAEMVSWAGTVRNERVHTVVIMTLPSCRLKLMSEI